jgi:aminoglycoside phosphotransferase (APT) family kinase protein
MDLLSQRASVQERIERVAEAPDLLRTAALDRLRRLPAGDRLCHGDFHADNVVLTRRGAVVLDWMTAVRGHPREMWREPCCCWSTPMRHLARGWRSRRCHVPDARCLRGLIGGGTHTTRVFAALMLTHGGCRWLSRVWPSDYQANANGCSSCLAVDSTRRRTRLRQAIPLLTKSLRAVS